jgi:hypothetical protein
MKMSQELKTNFMGVVVDSKGSQDPIILKALDYSASLLDIVKFVEVTEFKLNMVMFDYFWQVMVDNTRVHLHPRVMEWFGYEGEVREQRKNFIRMLKNNEIPFKELTRKDKEIELYPTIQSEIQALPSNVQNSKFLIMEPKDIKMAIMQLKTKNGYMIRQYYIDLEELMKMYVKYTLYFNERKAQYEITDLKQMMEDLKLDRKRQEIQREEDKERMNRQENYIRSLGVSLEDIKDQNNEIKQQNKEIKNQNKEIKRRLSIAVEDRAPLPEQSSKQERFVLLKRNDPEHPAYYTIRAQNAYTSNRIRAQQILFPDLQILLDFKCNPNSKSLYVRVKENLKKRGVLFDGNNIDLGETVNEQELIEEMNQINDVKYDMLPEN